MEHPGLNVTQIKADMSLEEIQVKIKDIVTRLNFAYQTMNQPLINQLEMVRETYSRAQQEALDEMFGNDKDNPVGNIDIS